jgi:putative iron-regulated protein
VATDLLVADLGWMAAQWGPEGEARSALTADPVAGVTAMLTGIGSLSFGEMAGQRVKLGLMLHDPEEEHDCFSDNTQNSHHDDVLGVQNVFLGQYKRLDGTTLSGPSLADLVAAADPALAATLTEQIAATLAATEALKQAVAGGMSYDMMLMIGNDAGAELIQTVIGRLVAQSRSIERVSTALSLSGVVVEGDDTLTEADQIFK